MVPVKELPVSHLRTVNLGLIGALVAALLLSGCGRKGALDPPPGGWELQSGRGRTDVSQRAGAPVPQQYDAEGRPIATGKKRSIPADWLID